jgi:hypothetical protein
MGNYTNQFENRPYKRSSIVTPYYEHGECNAQLYVYVNGAVPIFVSEKRPLPVLFRLADTYRFTINVSYMEIVVDDGRRFEYK